MSSVRRTVLVSIISILCTAPLDAAERAPLILKPISSWTVDRTTERCRLMRDFGTKAEPVTLVADSYGSRSSVRFLVYGKRVPRSGAPSGWVIYGFDSDTVKREEVGALMGVSGDVPAGSFTGAFAPYEPIVDFSKLSDADRLKLAAVPKVAPPDFGKGVHSITVKFGGARGSRATLQFDTESMEQPLQALSACVDQLQRSWGLDVARQKALTRLPIPKLSTIRKLQDSYPQSMLSVGQSAFVPVRLMIDATGQPTACSVQIGNVSLEFMAAVCASFAREFEPALDDKGMPVASVYQSSVIYLNN